MSTSRTIAERVQEISTGLVERRHLDRQRALTRLDGVLRENTCVWSEISSLLALIHPVLRYRFSDQAERSTDGSDAKESCDTESGDTEQTSAEPSWEAIQGALLAATKLLDYVRTRPERDEPVVAAESALLAEESLEASLCYLEYGEVRVREANATLMAALGRWYGVEAYRRVQSALLSAIYRNLERDQANPQPAPSTALPAAAHGHEKRADASPCSSSSPSASASSSSSTPPHSPRGHAALGMHDTEGWKALVTAFRTLQSLLEGIGEASLSCVTDELLQLIDRATLHTNRFLREAGYHTIAGIASFCRADRADDVALLRRIETCLLDAIARGLADNWSQVRYAASVATRAFMESAPFREELYYVLAPRMCLNRHYVAEGVRLYSLETWRRVMQSDGPRVLAKHIDATVEFYCSQAQADNHAVREASCRCVVELASQVDRIAVSPHVDVLLQVLMVCFRDASWPVRDCACLACGQFVLAFPEEARVQLDALYELWFAHLSDNISSVRRNTAFALGNVIKAYKQDALDKILPHIRLNILRARDQPADSVLHKTLENVTEFGVAAKRIRDNDPHVHSNQQVFSCGSLAPKLKRATGCMDHGFTRTREPWEWSDGCVHLLGVLSEIDPTLVDEFLPALLELSEIRSFAHFHMLLQTVWNTFVIIARALGAELLSVKKCAYTSKLVASAIASLDCGNRLAASAASDALEAIHQVIGQESFRGLVSDEQWAILLQDPFAGAYFVKVSSDQGE